MEKPMSYRWVRSSENQIIGGVCAGVAKALNMEAWVIRLLWLLSLFAFGFGLGLYIMCLIAFPRDDRKEMALNKMVLGVCARLHQRGDIEVGLARLIALLLLVGSAGAAVIGYILLHFILEERKSPSPN